MTGSLEQRLREAARGKQGRYVPRTDHIDELGQPIFINRLILENSPYLLQHAHNPVNWYAWGDEAFAQAVKDDKPVFLSIGYSTCHWCHVMEVESFDNPAIAALLNQDFIAIKLDREQHPDIDDVYMTAVQMVSGHGGWPMSNFLLPDGRPFFGATYFPPQQFAALLRQVAELWQTRRGELEASAARLQQQLTEALEHRGAARSLDSESLDSAVQQLLEREDLVDGGLAGAPKFPQEPLLLYCLQRAARLRDSGSAAFACRALQAMACGGMYDQVGGGFHRYSVDAQWLVPHFEKMLYNQSQLGRGYLLAWQLTGKPFFLRTLTRTMDYVLREMQLPQGGFYSATDADSEDEEGKYFVWTLAELRELLSSAELQLLASVYELREAGNFEGATILAVDRSRQTQREIEMPEALDPVLLKLRQHREQQRIAPLRDDKLIVAWTAAMATTLVQTGHVLARPDYLDAARRAVSLILEHCHNDADGLRRIFLDGEVSIPAQLEDYANLVEALLALSDHDGVGTDYNYLSKAHQLMTQMLDIFWDQQNGGFFTGPVLATGPTVARSCSAADGATVSAVATALACLVGLLQRVANLHLPADADIRLRQKIEATIAAHGAQVTDSPPAHVSFLRAVDLFNHGPLSVPAWLADGRVMVTLHSDERVAAERILTLVLSIESDWHLSASGFDIKNNLQPLQLTLAADECGWELTRVDYPAPSSSGEYRGEVLLTARLTRTAVDLLSHSTGLVLTLQACSDQRCLSVEFLRLRL